MKIAYISESIIPSTYANSVHVMKMCQAMTKNKYNVFLFSIKPLRTLFQKRRVKIQHHYGIREEFIIRRIIKFPNRMYGRHIYAFLSVLFSKILRLDAIITRHSLVPFWAEIFRIKYYLELHEVDLFDELVDNNKRYRYLVKIVFITKALQEEVLNKHKVLTPCTNIVIPDSVDLDRFGISVSSDEMREKMGIPNKFTIGYVGSLYDGRGIRFIIELAKTLNECNFIIVGGRDNEVSHWRGVVENEHVKNVYLMGFVANSDIPSYLSLSNILIMPYEDTEKLRTRNWCSPMKMFEYMAAGKPIISSYLPVLEETLVEGRNVFYVDYNSLIEWKGVINDLMNNKKLMERISLNNLQDIKKYTWDKRVHQIFYN